MTTTDGDPFELEPTPLDLDPTPLDVEEEPQGWAAVLGLQASPPYPGIDPDAGPDDPARYTSRGAEADRARGRARAAGLSIEDYEALTYGEDT